MKYQGGWVRKDGKMAFAEFKPGPSWEPYERDQKAIEAVHRFADAENGIFSYVHAIEWFGLRVRCLTHRPIEGFAVPWTPHRRMPKMKSSTMEKGS